jgi:hypothetical protein
VAEDSFQHDLHEVFGDRAAEFSEELRGLLRRLWELGSEHKSRVFAVMDLAAARDDIGTTRVTRTEDGRTFVEMLEPEGWNE